MENLQSLGTSPDMARKTIEADKAEERVAFVATKRWVHLVDVWRAKQVPTPSRSEAIRVATEAWISAELSDVKLKAKG